MKLYYTGEGAACLIYVPQNGVTVQVTLRKEGLDYPAPLAAEILSAYGSLVRRDTQDMKAEVDKVAMPETLKRAPISHTWAGEETQKTEEKL